MTYKNDSHCRRRWLQLGMATAQLLTNLGIIAYIALLEHNATLGDWAAVELSQTFEEFAIVVAVFGFVSYFLLIFYIFIASC